jgi:N-acetylneuraminic acid mutarotase
LKSSEIYDPATGKWSPSGEMTSARKNHCATLLQDGKVLVTGGLDVGDGVLQSQEGKGVISLAEIYDPATGVWEATADMSKVRTLHQSVLLQDGRALVIGGGDSDYEPITSVEIYDPSTGTWTETGELIKARQEHTATVLSDGRVLVTGGGRIDATETSEIYDPSTGAWSEAGEMITGRISGVAARLNDGRVLIVGGREAYQWQEGSVLTAEIYDPVAKSWSAGANVLEFRHDTAVSILSDGRVMVVAGAMSEGMGVLVLQTAEIYDPSTNVWTATAGLAQARTGHSSTVMPDGKVLVVGGNTAGGTPISTVEMYDPSTGTWSFAAATP